MQFALRIMKNCLVFFATLSVLTAFEAQAQPGGYLDIYSDFDASQLSYDERRVLQLALALQGDYIGVLDGDWGWLSQRAIEAYSWREMGEAPAVWHIAILAGEFLFEAERSGWTLMYLDDFGVSLVFPNRAYREEPPTGAYVNWAHISSSLRISAARTGAEPMLQAHAHLLRNAERSSEPYLVRRDDRHITRVFDGTGYRYARSELLSGLWTTIIIYASRQDEPLLNAVAAGIAPGNLPPIRFPSGGYLERTLFAVEAVASRNLPDSPPTHAAPSGSATSSGHPSDRPSQLPASVGTAFMINGQGYLMTNAHVVEACRRIEVAGQDAQLLSASDQFDLAILVAPTLAEQASLAVAPNPAALNENIVAAGYPLQGILGGLNVTQGSVTSVTGMGGDGIHFQMSAPIQPGSSGGPVVDEFGNVVGVVVARLAPDMRDTERPDIPQNVNFAIRAEILQLLLAQNNVVFAIGEEEEALTPVEQGALVSAATHPVLCEH